VNVEVASCHTPNCRDTHYDTHYQMGTIVTNIVLNMEWKGVQRELLLESGNQVYVTRVGKVISKIPPLLIMQTNTSRIDGKQSSSKPKK
jgi:hypothetical protein